ncbi:MAG: rod shape-determining protein RodA [Holosporales bacterium]|nr:rod shape-determining protein RodA [Holosporales bacterium]
MLFFFVLASIMAISLLLLFSAGGGTGQWCWKQALRFVCGFSAMLLFAAVPVRFWHRFAYGLYAISLLALLATSFLGVIGMGAQRWLKVGFIQFQPSEFIRITSILAIARFFSDNPSVALKNLLTPSLLIMVPVLITVKQPDLGTAMLLLAGGVGMFFLAGVPLRFFYSAALVCCCTVPFLWTFLHDYQKNRILMFLNPALDPLGAGYHIIQSKIAIGSGGVWGKGFLAGTQSSLNFLPEKQTDFIFTLLSEEFGFLGVTLLVFLYCLLILMNLSFFSKARYPFDRLVIAGLTLSFSLYATINIAMVAGLLPVVGIPLPLVSYGGTSLVTIMSSFGIVLSVALSKRKLYSKNQLT